MDHERWRLIEELYHSVSRLPAEQRTKFLDDTCQCDIALRKEIESLLAYESSAKEFIEMPALDFAAKLMAGDSLDESEIDPLLDSVILQRFQVLERLGRGGMGVVYKSEDTRLHRMVALKFLPTELSRDPYSLERFQREAHAASALNHPNICTIYDIGEHDGRPFIAMELLEGQTLERRIEKRPLPLKELLKFGIEIIDALNAAHVRDVIHRDIKPANIFVTGQGQAKILDFGLAKLGSVSATTTNSSPSDPRDDDELESPRESLPLTAPDLFFSLTGMAMGTAGYMSPEQVRGEKLDARTDLFSFGLVLYEMATGQRAFKGDTGPLLQGAILNGKPTPPRGVNPKLPLRLEQIITKALEKDREARYQSASEIRTDLEILKQEMESRNRTHWWKRAVGVAAAVLIVSAILWFARRQPMQPPTERELKLRQLTINSGENRVLNGAISPDGRYLAYTDMKGMHIKHMESGLTRDVSQPEALQGRNVDWEVIPSGWFPDNATFIANAFPSASEQDSKGPSIWRASVRGGAPRKLRGNAVAYSVSHDGSLVSFGTNKGKLGPREIWLMQPNGDNAQKLFETDENSSIGGLLWSPDGQRAIYVRSNESGDTFVSRSLKGGPITTLFTSTETKNITDGMWLPDGRLIYSVKESEAVGDTCNYWTIRMDDRTGERIENPTRVTNWTGFCMNYSSVTSDGKQLVFQEWAGHSTVYVAETGAGGSRILSSRHFTLDESFDYLQGWTPDGKAILFTSNRSGNLAIYKQSLNEDTPELIASGAAGFRQARVSPDGRWVLSFVSPKPGGPSAPEQLVRVPVTGGLPELFFQASPESGISCAVPPSNLCVLNERTEDGKQAVVTAFDSVKGRGRELARFDLNPNEQYWFCELSPEGTRLLLSPSPEGPMQVLSLRDHEAQLIPAKGLKISSNVSWAADGNGLYVDSSAKNGAVLLYVDLRGNTRVLWNNYGSSWAYGMPSPDGRHVAIAGSSTNSNMWMMQNF